MLEGVDACPGDAVWECVAGVKSNEATARQSPTAMMFFMCVLSFVEDSLAPRLCLWGSGSQTVTSASSELVRDRRCAGEVRIRRREWTVGEKWPSLTMSAVSSTFSSTLLYALGEERHFALLVGLRCSNPGSLLIVGVKNSVRPIHLFDHNRDHDYYFELPWEGERDTQSLRR